MITASFIRNRILTESSDASRELFHLQRFGNLLDNGKVHLSTAETLYLIEKQKIVLHNGRKQVITEEKLLRHGEKDEKNFWIRYSVFKNLRDRGYIVKTALKFGADYRVYDRGVKPGEDHAKWVVYPVHESNSFTWHDFSAKNRVAHSTKKRLLIGVVDDEGDVTYYEVRWMRP